MPCGDTGRVRKDVTIPKWVYEQALVDNGNLEARVSVLMAFIEKWITVPSIQLTAHFVSPGAKACPCQFCREARLLLDVVEG